MPFLIIVVFHFHFQMKESQMDSREIKKTISLPVTGTLIEEKSTSNSYIYV